MASTSGSIVDRVIGSGVAAWFRRAGFRRKGRCFYRPSGPVVHTANIQASKLNRPESAVFTLNLGVEWLDWHRAWTNAKPLTNPALAPTFVQSRLHPVSGPGQDYWWPATDIGDPLSTAADVVRALEGFAERFWTHYSDLGAVLQEMDSGKRVPTGSPQPLVHAALLRNANRSADARMALRSEAARSCSPALVEAVAARLGLPHGA
jgi:hypothetical protein